MGNMKKVIQSFPHNFRLSYQNGSITCTKTILFWLLDEETFVGVTIGGPQFIIIEGMVRGMFRQNFKGKWRSCMVSNGEEYSGNFSCRIGKGYNMHGRYYLEQYGQSFAGGNFNLSPLKQKDPTFTPSA